MLWLTVELLCLSQCKFVAATDRILQTVHGHVNARNFTYYRLTLGRKFTIVLDSLEGDADLYVSEGNRQPHYRDLDYNMSSNTCGRELIVISHKLKRPIVAGVIGHEQYPESKFLMTVVDGELSYDDAAKISPEDYNKSQPDGKENTAWNILSLLLKLILEVLL